MNRDQVASNRRPPPPPQSLPMSILAWIMLGSLATVAFTGGLSILNLRRYRRRFALAAPASTTPIEAPLISVCIPARNEEANIEACIRSLLAQDWPNLEVLVYDDQSTDQTPAILARLAAADARVRRVPTHPLPDAWNGKQHACWRMSQSAVGPWMLFTDADVRFEPTCISIAIREATARADRHVALLSTFPRQIVGSPAEALLVPMIFFLLFSYLPMGRMRRTWDASASAGCGQFLLVRADAYAASQGHAAFKDSMHDGIKMPRAVRRAGFSTDLFDATDLCSVRMYRGLASTWRGFAKNAYEGLGSIALLAFITVLHALAHVLPWLVVATSTLLLATGRTGAWPMGLSDPRASLFALLAITFALAQRAVLAVAFRHPLWIVPAHPLGVTLMTAVQWHSLVLHLRGQRAWKGRVQNRAETAVN